jgi:hypothetical protein
MKKEIVIDEKIFKDKEEAKVYAGEYVLKGLNAIQLATIQDKSLGFDRRTGKSVMRSGMMNLEMLKESIIEAPFSLSKGKKDKLIEEMPGWLYISLFQQADDLSGIRLMEEDIKK